MNLIFFSMAEALKKLSSSITRLFIFDGVFSIDVGQEPVGVAGSTCWARSSYNLQPALKG